MNREFCQDPLETVGDSSLRLAYAALDRGDIEEAKRMVEYACLEGAHIRFLDQFQSKAHPAYPGGPVLRQITARRLAEVRVHECWSDQCSVELRPNMQAPLHLWPVRASGAG